MKQDNKCPKCGGEFESGIIPDFKYAGVISSKWATKIKHFGFLENKKDITSMRCKNCGYLENYAN